MTTSSDEIQIHALRCGTVGTDETIPDRSKSGNPLAFSGLFRGEKHRVWLPVYSYLIVHPRGKILVDTGWHTDTRLNQKEHMSWQLNIASKAKLPPGEAVSEQLASLGFKPEDLDLVLFTHLDVDHASGAKLVRGAKRFLAAEDELKAAAGGDIRYNRRLWDGLPLEPLFFKNTGLGPEGRSLDWFGDGSVQFIDVSGHSAGTTGVLITRNDRFVFITSDACYNRASWENQKVPGLMADKEKAGKALKWIHELSLKPGMVEILATHDPEVEPHTITL